jgi:hypothetical protein
MHASFEHACPSEVPSIPGSSVSGFYNLNVDKRTTKKILLWFLENYGSTRTSQFLEELKSVGFYFATEAGVSLGFDDLKIPATKSTILAKAESQIQETGKRFVQGRMTAIERYQKIIDIWRTASENLKDEVIKNFQKTNLLNPLYMMAFSGARGNISQVRQLVGMRGLMSDSAGGIIDFPIRKNFCEGLTITEYLISCYGARKGLIDTALKTADSGYLTRRLVDVAHGIMIGQKKCSTKEFFELYPLKEPGSNNILLSLEKRIIGRVVALPALPEGSWAPDLHVHGSRFGFPKGEFETEFDTGVCMSLRSTQLNVADPRHGEAQEMRSHDKPCFSSMGLGFAHTQAATAMTSEATLGSYRRSGYIGVAESYMETHPSNEEEVITPFAAFEYTKRKSFTSLQVRSPLTCCPSSSGYDERSSRTTTLKPIQRGRSSVAAEREYGSSRVLVWETQPNPCEAEGIPNLGFNSMGLRKGEAQLHTQAATAPHAEPRQAVQPSSFSGSGNTPSEDICQLCYGWSLSQGRLVSLGEAVGILAAQSIGEPGTQLTMRTFHTGGIFSSDVDVKIFAPHDGIVFFAMKPHSKIRISEQDPMTPLTKSWIPFPPYQNAGEQTQHQTESEFPKGHKIRNYYGETGFLIFETFQLVLVKEEPKGQNGASLVPPSRDHKGWASPYTGENLCSFLSLPAQSLIFVHPGQFVKKNTLCAELSYILQALPQNDDLVVPNEFDDSELTTPDEVALDPPVVAPQLPV